MHHHDENTNILSHGFEGTQNASCFASSHGDATEGGSCPSLQKPAFRCLASKLGLHTAHECKDPSIVHTFFWMPRLSPSMQRAENCLSLSAPATPRNRNTGLRSAQCPHDMRRPVGCCMMIAVVVPWGSAAMAKSLRATTSCSHYCICRVVFGPWPGRSGLGIQLPLA